MCGIARSATRVGTSPNTGETGLSSAWRFFPECDFWRYLLGMQVADWTTQTWLQGFNDVGAQIIGKTADELMALKDVCHLGLQYLRSLRLTIRSSGRECRCILRDH